jgi:hypothetical protein
MSWLSDWVRSMADRFVGTTEGRLERMQLQLDSMELALARIEDLLIRVQHQQEVYVMAEIDDLVEQVQAVKGVEDSALALITGLSDKVAQLVQDATDLATLKQQVAQATQEIRQNAQPLAEAVSANSPHVEAR